MTDDDHTSETADAAADSIHGPREPEQPEDASPHGDDAGPAPAGEESPPEAEPAAAEPPAPAAPERVAESTRRARAPRSPRKPAAKTSPPRRGRPSRAKVVPHLTPAERAARGKAARAEVGRSVHGEWASPANRRDPVDLLEAQASTRVQELVPIRYGRMLVSPFTFFRGAASVMASDLSGGPRTGLEVQLCGDAHLSNFGVYAASDRRLVFDINDFDETLPGPFSGTRGNDLLNAAIDEAITRKPKGHDFIIDRRHNKPAVSRHMSVTGG